MVDVVSADLSAVVFDKENVSHGTVPRKTPYFYYQMVLRRQIWEQLIIQLLLSTNLCIPRV
jgi:hypothetical protein